LEGDGKKRKGKVRDEFGEMVEMEDKKLRYGLLDSGLRIDNGNVLDDMWVESCGGDTILSLSGCLNKIRGCIHSISHTM